MKLETISLDETGCFSPLFIDYMNTKDSLKSFYGLTPKIENFEKQISNKEFSDSAREILNAVLIEQYDDLETSEAVRTNIALLKQSNTYTITTGHQLNICTGPLYFIYKIVTVINICKQLQTKYPNSNFVPVYWMATEDHDLEEINHFFLFDEKVQWETDQTGPVGRMDTKSLETIFDKLPEKADFFVKAYKEANCLADAVRSYVNELFCEQGLVVVDADGSRLKAQFTEVIKDDIIQHNANQLVENTTAKINELGYKTQVFPREINFFYIEDGFRERIIEKEGLYKVKGKDFTLTKEEILQLIDSNPEKFSPNVILRPLYQETILPNLAYIGGPAEVAYWLQLMPVFDHYKTAFPILMPRNFGLIIARYVLRKLNKAAISLSKLFQPIEEIKKQYVVENTDKEIHLTQEIGYIKAAFGTVREKATDVDKTLGGFVGAQEAKALKSLDNIEKRIKKSEERNQEVSIQQIESVKNSLFPNGSLQERHDNYLNFYVNNPDIMAHLLDLFNPFSYNFHILKEEEVSVGATAS